MIKGRGSFLRLTLLSISVVQEVCSVYLSHVTSDREDIIFWKMKTIKDVVFPYRVPSLQLCTEPPSYRELALSLQRELHVMGEQMSPEGRMPSWFAQ